MAYITPVIPALRTTYVAPPVLVPVTPSPPVFVQRFVSSQLSPRPAVAVPVRQFSAQTPARNVLPSARILTATSAGNSPDMGAQGGRERSPETRCRQERRQPPPSTSAPEPVEETQDDRYEFYSSHHLTHKAFEAIVCREKQILDKKKAVDGEGELRRMLQEEMDFAQRSSTSGRYGFDSARDTTPGGSSLPATVGEADGSQRYTPRSDLDRRFRQTFRSDAGTPTGTTRRLLREGADERQGSPYSRGFAYRY